MKNEDECPRCGHEDYKVETDGSYSCNICGHNPKDDEIDG